MPRLCAQSAIAMHLVPSRRPSRWPNRACCLNSCQRVPHTSVCLSHLHCCSTRHCPECFPAVHARPLSTPLTLASQLSWPRLRMCAGMGCVRCVARYVSCPGCKVVRGGCGTGAGRARGVCEACVRRGNAVRVCGRGCVYVVCICVAYCGCMALPVC